MEDILNITGMCSLTVIAVIDFLAKIFNKSLFSINILKQAATEEA